MYFLYVLKVASKIDLVEIWNNQAISEDMEEVFKDLSMLEIILKTQLKCHGILQRRNLNKLKSKKPKFSDFTKHFQIKDGDMEEFEEVIQKENKKKSLKIVLRSKDADKWFA